MAMMDMFFGKKAFYNRTRFLMMKRIENSTNCYVKSIKKKIKCAAKGGWDHVTLNHYFTNLSKDELDGLYDWFERHGFTIDREVGTISWK